MFLDVPCVHLSQSFDQINDISGLKYESLKYPRLFKARSKSKNAPEKSAL
jgi:hypothetical protein